MQHAQIERNVHKKRSTPPKSDLLDLSSDDDVQIRRCDLPEQLDVKTDAEPAPNHEDNQLFNMFKNKVPDALLDRLNSETELVMQSDNRDAEALQNHASILSEVYDSSHTYLETDHTATQSDDECEKLLCRTLNKPYLKLKKSREEKSKLKTQN